MVGDLYCEKVRTLSTNWNLKFQRGETGGPYPRVEMALGFFPPRLLFFVLISPSSPGGGGGARRDRRYRVVSTQGELRCQRPGGASVWRMPLGLHVPRDRLLGSSDP